MVTKRTGVSTPLPLNLDSLLSHHWKLVLTEGVVLVLLGCAAVVLPSVATLAIEIFLGWILLLSGIVGVWTTFALRGSPGFVWSLVSAVVAILAGAVLLHWPLSGTVALTLVLIVFFLAEGIASMMLGLAHRRALAGSSGWLILSGAIDLVLAALILAGLPDSTGWVLGLLVGINMIFGGAALLARAFRLKGSAAAQPVAEGGAELLRPGV